MKCLYTVCTFFLSTKIRRYKDKYMYKMYKRCVVLVDTRVKQADVVLLGYPLMFNMTEATRRNDLRIYEAVSFHMYW